MFPYSFHPIRLEYEEKKGKIICFFECEEHLEKHLVQHKLNKKKVTILHRPEDYIDFLDNSNITFTEPSKSKKKVVTKRKPKKKKNV